MVSTPLDGVDGELEQRRQVGENGRVVRVHVQGRREDRAAENVRRIVPREQPRHVRARGAQRYVVVVHRNKPVFFGQRNLGSFITLQSLSASCRFQNSEEVWHGGMYAYTMYVNEASVDVPSLSCLSPLGENSVFGAGLPWTPPVFRAKQNVL